MQLALRLPPVLPHHVLQNAPHTQVNSDSAFIYPIACLCKIHSVLHPCCRITSCKMHQACKSSHKGSPAAYSFGMPKVRSQLYPCSHVMPCKFNHACMLSWRASSLTTHMYYTCITQIPGFCAMSKEHTHTRTHTCSRVCHTLHPPPDAALHPPPGSLSAGSRSFPACRCTLQ